MPRGSWEGLVYVIKVEKSLHSFQTACDPLARRPQTMSWLPCLSFQVQPRSQEFLTQSMSTAPGSAPAWELAPSGAYFKGTCVTFLAFNFLGIQMMTSHGHASSQVLLSRDAQGFTNI